MLFLSKKQDWFGNIRGDLLAGLVVVRTHNLAFGVLTGALLASLFFANKIGHFMVVESKFDEATNTRIYQVVGQVFFNSADKLAVAFDFKEAVEKVVINLHRAHFWDISSVTALDKVVIKFRREGAEVELIGLNEASATIVDRFGIHDKAEEIEKIMGGH